jgi:hypothetical protein
MPQNKGPQFYTPTGKPQAITMTTQKALDRWHAAGWTPPSPEPGESQYFYATRLGNNFTNRQRGYAGPDGSQTTRIRDKRANVETPTSKVIESTRGRMPSSFEKSKITLGSGKAMGTKSFGALLGIANALEASKGRR